jgi:MOSC domain-containing protein YiiM
MKLIGIAVRDSHKAPMRTIDGAQVTLKEGIIEDFRGKSLKRQVTVMSLLHWDAACNLIEFQIQWFNRRANLLIDEINFNDSQIGKKLFFNEVCLEVAMECDPCHRMVEVHPKLREALIPDWRGGACCRVIKGGVINVGEKVSLVD